MRCLAILIGMALTTGATAKIVSEPVPYEHDGVKLEGVLYYDDAAAGKRPVVFVVHEWWGLNDFAKEQAQKVAELGYVAMAVDMYGKGVVTTDPNEAAKLVTPFREDGALLRRRFKAAMDAVHSHARVDNTRMAAMGFCFGGSTSLAAAAAGYDLDGVVSFHGSLSAIPASDVPNIKARILVLHGAADTLVPDEAVNAFQNSLRGSTVDWQLIAYGGAKHSFTNPAADKLGMPGVGYDERTAKRSFDALKRFLEEIFAPTK